MARTGLRWLVLTGVVVGLTGTAPREALAQVPSLRFDPRLLPARLPLASVSAGLRAQALRFDARLLPARPPLFATSGQVEAAAMRFNAPPVLATSVLAATFLGALIPSLYASKFPTATCAPCNPAGLTFLDRGAIGQVRPGSAAVSDGALYAVMGGAALLVFGEAPKDKNVIREDMTVFLQSIATASLITSWLKVIVHRPRPFRYVAAETTITVQSGLSFPSGHSTAAWSALVSYWSMQNLRGRARQNSARIALLATAAVTTAVFRVLARQHFPTDVMAGAAIGATVGWIIPRLYAKRANPPPR
jgi:membrane-associated phospholipid phosphatase